MDRKAVTISVQTPKGEQITAKELMMKYFEDRGVDLHTGEIKDNTARSAKGSHAFELPPTFKTHKEGWIWKKKEFFDHWQKRYFILDKEVIYYYKQAPISGTKQLGSIDLKLIINITKDSVNNNIFSLEIPNRVYTLRTDTEKERGDWIGVLTQNWARSIRTQHKRKFSQKSTTTSQIQPKQKFAAEQRGSGPLFGSGRNLSMNESSNAPVDDGVSKKEGWVYKIGGDSIMGHFQRRWFILRFSTLSYYKTKKGSTSRGTIDLSKILSIELDAVKSKPNSWSIVTSQRIYYLCNDTQEERESWIKEIKALSSPKVDSGSSTSSASSSANDDEEAEPEESIVADEKLVDEVLAKQGIYDEEMAVDYDSEESDFDVSVHEGFYDVYDVGRILGEGGFSKVLEARNKRSGKKFAVKWIRKDSLDDLVYLKREIKLMKEMDHPNVVKLYEVWEEETDFFLVMELVSGVELFEMVSRKGQYSEKHAHHIIKQLIDVVDYLHNGVGIAHRDIKPENILTSGDAEREVLKLVDFGLAKKFGIVKRHRLATKVGTPCYLAPEVVTSDGEQEYSQAVDMWSIGVIIYILLCGYHPFIGQDLHIEKAALMERIKNVQYNFNHPNWAVISDAAKNLIKRLITKDPRMRYSAKQAREDPWITGRIQLLEKPLDTFMLRQTSDVLKSMKEEAFSVPK